MSEIVKLYKTAKNKEAFEKSLPTIKDLTDYYSVAIYIKKQRWFEINKNERTTLGKDNYTKMQLTRYQAEDEFKKLNLPFDSNLDNVIIIKPNKESKINFKKISESIDNIIQVVNADNESRYKANHQTVNNEVVITLKNDNEIIALNKNYILFNLTENNGRIIDRLLNNNKTYSKTKKELKEEKRLEKQKRKELNARTIKGPTGADEFPATFIPQNTILAQTTLPTKTKIIKSKYTIEEILSDYFINNKTITEIRQKAKDNNVDLDAIKFDDKANEINFYARDIAMNYSTLGAEHYKKILKQEKINKEIQKIIIKHAKAFNKKLTTLDDIITD